MLGSRTPCPARSVRHARGAAAVCLAGFMVVRFEAHAAPDEARVYRASFGEALKQETDTLLEGANATSAVVFQVPQAWTLLEDPRLELNFEHSGALAPERSHLTVVLNEQPIGTIALGAGNGQQGTFALTLPRALLQPWNRITLRATQHLEAGCQDPFDPALWTRVRRDSAVLFSYAPNAFEPTALDLASLPYPLFDETGFGPATVALALGDAPTPATVSAVGRIGLSLGRLAGYRGVDVAPTVADLRDATTHVIVIGLAADNVVTRSWEDTSALAPGEGLVTLRPNPWNPELAVLVVTGADEAGLARAVNAVAGRQRRELLAGPRAVVRVAADADPPGPRELPRRAPHDASFEVGALGIDSVTTHGMHTPSVRVPLGLEGDARVREGEAKVHLAWGHAPRLDPRHSALEVRLDDTTIGSFPLTDEEGTARREATLALPAHRLRPDSVLDLRFHLLPQGYDRCVPPADPTLWATVHADTRIEVPRDHVAELPDLGRLQFGSWPFTLDGAQGATVLAVPDAPTPTEVAAGFELAARLGRTSDASSPQLRMTTASQALPSATRDAHLMLLEGSSNHEGIAQLLRAGALHARPELLVADGHALVQVAETRPRASIQEILHPFAEERAVLVLRGPTPELLATAVDQLADPARVTRLAGDVAWVDDAGEPQTAALATRVQVGEPALRAQLVATARRHGVWMGLAVLGAAYFLSVLRRAWAHARGGA